MSIDLSKCDVFTPIAGSAGKGAGRAGFGLETAGWGGIVEAAREATREHGLRRFWLRGVYGDDGRSPIDYGPPLGKRAACWEAGEIVRAWAPAIANGVDLGIYSGSVPYDPYLRMLQEQRRWLEWLEAFAAPLRPWQDAGASVFCFDHVGGDRDPGDATHGEAGTPAYHALRLFRLLSGCKVWGEPHGGGTVGLDGCVVEDTHWRRANAPSKRTFRESFAGEVVRIVNTEQAAEVVLADGHTPALTYGLYTRMTR